MNNIKYRRKLLKKLAAKTRAITLIVGDNSYSFSEILDGADKGKYNGIFNPNIQNWQSFTPFDPNDTTGIANAIVSITPQPQPQTQTSGTGWLSNPLTTATQAYRDWWKSRNPAKPGATPAAKPGTARPAAKPATQTGAQTASTVQNNFQANPQADDALEILKSYLLQINNFIPSVGKAVPADFSSAVSEFTSKIGSVNGYQSIKQSLEKLRTIVPNLLSQQQATPWLYNYINSAIGQLNTTYNYVQSIQDMPITPTKPVKK
jgi:hypothetical protein